MLDPRGRQEVMETVAYLNKEKGITIVYITHFMEETIHADRVLVMNEGEIYRCGTPVDIFSDIEALKKVNMDVPMVVELVRELRKEGFHIPEILSIDELVDVIC
ncbi:MAG: energy-coupling factor transporter ATPase, partial [Halanaerobiales bacterium]